MPPSPERIGDGQPTPQEQLQALIHLSTAATTRLDTISQQLTTQVTNMTHQTDALRNLITMFAADRGNRGPPPPPPPPPPPLPQNQPRPPKIVPPNFSGENPLDWLFQANNYFQYYTIPLDQRVQLVVFYFTGDALSWYKHLANNNFLGSWPEFSRALELRFSPSTYENHQATLFKLKQSSTVAVY